MDRKDCVSSRSINIHLTYVVEGNRSHPSLPDIYIVHRRDCIVQTGENIKLLEEISQGVAYLSTRKFWQ